MGARDPGDRDTSFSGDGVRFIDFGRYDGARAVFADAEGSLVLAGRSGRFAAGRDRVILAKVPADGRGLDGSFGEDGRVLFDPTPRADPASEWTSSGGGYVALGVFEGADDLDDYYLARFTKTGAVDRRFGDAGIVVGRFRGEQNFELVNDIVTLADGRIIISGTVDVDTVVKAYRPDGSHARGFGRDGHRRVLDNSRGVLARSSDGGFLVAGEGPNRTLVIDAFNADGSRDRSFGGGGDGRTRLVVTGGLITPTSTVILADGRIVVAGEIGAFASDSFVARFLSDGRVDRSFGCGDGWRRIDIGPIDRPQAVVERADGKLVVVGAITQDRFGDSRRAEVYLAGLRQDGRLWRAFGDNGIVRDDFGLETAYAENAALVGGRLVVVGVAKTDMFAARYLLGRD